MVGRKGSTGRLSIAQRVLLVLCAVLCVFGTAHAERNEIYDLHLPSQSVAEALNALSEQTGVPVVFPYDLARNRHANPVTGRFTASEALDVLLEGTGLTGGLSDKGVLMITAGETLVNKNRPTRMAALLASLTAAFNAPAHGGPEAESNALEEVLVSARKREERLQDVPASIAAASGQTISDLNIVGVTELDAIAPGLTFVTNPSRFGSGPSIALRGVSTQTQGSGVQDSVGIVIDGVVIERAKAGAFPDLSDIARVEVLRGPQGTLFGKNASAGVINITTKDPTPEISADLGIEYGTHNERTVRASLSGPLIDHRLLGRFSAYTRSRDGYVENIFDGSEWEGDDQQGFRSKLLFTPTADDKLKLSLDYVEQDNDAGANIIRAFTPVTPQYVRDALGSIVGLENDRINSRPQGENHHRARGAAFQWDRSIGEHTLTALTAYRDFNQDFHAGTYVWLTPLNEGDQFGFTDQDQSSVEVRLASPTGDRIDYVGGIYLLSNETETGIYDPGTLIVGTSNRQSRNSISVVETLNYAAFAEANLHLNDRLTVTGGLRWTQEDVDVTITGYPIPPGNIRFGHPLGVTSDSASADKVSWRASTQWRLDTDRMLYLSVATGVKGPGFNVNTSVLGDAHRVEPETSTSYEAGIKSQFLNRTLTLNLNAFYSVFENFQTQGGLSLPGSPTTRIILLNADELVTQGFEAEFSALLTDTSEISLNAAYIDAQFEKFLNAPCYAGQARISSSCAANNTQDLSGSRLPNTPEWTFNLRGKQDFTLPGLSWRAFATVDYGWRSDVQWNVLQSPDGIEPSYGLLGASFGLRSENERFHVKLYGKNLTDKFHTSGIVVDNQITHFLPPDYRRIVGIDALMRF